MTNRYLLDSWAVLALLYKEKPASVRVEQLLKEAAGGNVTLFLSVINLGEVYYIFGRKRGEQAADTLVEKIKQLPIQVLAVDEQDVLAAARYKMTHLISYADAFAVAAAAKLDAVLLTGDPELLTMEDVVAVEMLHR